MKIDVKIEKKSLANVLKAIRAENKMSLREFSDYLKISHSYLNKLEKGSDVRTLKYITPTVDTLEKISGGLGLNIETFMDMCGYFDGKEVSKEDVLSKLDSMIRRSSDNAVLSALKAAKKNVEDI